MSPLISAGFATSAFAEKITARYRVHTHDATVDQDGSPPPKASAPRIQPPFSASARAGQSRGGTLALSI